MTNKTSPPPDYTVLNMPLPRSVAAILNDLAPEPKPPGMMAVLLSIPITPPLTAGQRARLHAKPRAKVHTLNIINSVHANVGVLRHLLSCAVKPYTRIRMSSREQHLLWGDARKSPETRPLMPSPSSFMGVPIVLFTEAELHAKLTPAPRAKKAAAPRKQYSAEYLRARATKVQGTCQIRLWNPTPMTIENVREIVGNEMRGRRVPFTSISMSAQCRDKLWAEAQEYTNTTYTPHPIMPDKNTFTSLPLRIVTPRASWGDWDKQQ